MVSVLLLLVTRVLLTLEVYMHWLCLRVKILYFCHDYSIMDHRVIHQMTRLPLTKMDSNKAIKGVILYFSKRESGMTLNTNRAKWI